MHPIRLLSLATEGILPEAACPGKVDMVFDIYNLGLREALTQFGAVNFSIDTRII